MTMNKLWDTYRQLRQMDLDLELEKRSLAAVRFGPFYIQTLDEIRNTIRLAYQRIESANAAFESD